MVDVSRDVVFHENLIDCASKINLPIKDVIRHEEIQEENEQESPDKEAEED